MPFEDTYQAFLFGGKPGDARLALGYLSILGRYLTWHGLDSVCSQQTESNYFDYSNYVIYFYLLGGFAYLYDSICSFAASI